jgi:hypothetical protein
MKYTHKHKITGQLMQFIKGNETVGTFRVSPYEHNGLNKGWHDIKICKMQNVEAIQHQTTAKGGAA